MALYTSTKNGKVEGVEHTPFILPFRWTFATLRACVHDYVARLFEKPKEEIQIDNLYYKKSGKSKSIVALKSDADISGMIDEYPLTFPSGKKKSLSRSTLIIMAVDWSVKKKAGKINKSLPLKKLVINRGTTFVSLFNASGVFVLYIFNFSVWTFLFSVFAECSGFPPITPRRSPRLTSMRSPMEKGSMDIFVFAVDNSKQGAPKLSKTSFLLKDFSEDCPLSALKQHLKATDDANQLFLPANGIFWLRKGTKQMVQLKSENDFVSCKDEYRDKSKGRVSSIRVACCAINIENAGLDIYPRLQCQHSFL